MIGYGGVAWRCAILLVTFVGAAFAFALVGNARVGRSGTPAVSAELPVRE